jgi:WhiB family redox-sensing transcriptional regulator
MDRAACATTQKDVFYPDQIGVPEQKAYREARKICADCPVIRECLDYAMEVETDQARRYGMFGGTTPRDRERLQSERDAKAARTMLGTRLQPPIKREGAMQQALLEALPDPELREI